jgi:hypothetical protein
MPGSEMIPAFFLRRFTKAPRVEVYTKFWRYFFYCRSKEHGSRGRAPQSNQLIEAQMS